MKDAIITIRPAAPGDCHIIAKAVAMAIGEDSAKEYCGEHYLELLEEVARAENTQYSYLNALVAEADGAAAGAIIGYDGALLNELREGTLGIIYRDRERPGNFPDETEAGEFYLDSIGVLPEYRGMGIGRRMISEMRRRAFELGHSTVGLIVDKTNPGAEKLYLSLGFRRVGSKMFFDHDMWHMQVGGISVTLGTGDRSVESPSASAGVP